MTWRGGLCLVLLVMVGCVGLPAGLPAARTFASPVGAAGSRTYRTYLPLWIESGNKLGLGGCPGSCEVLGCSWCYSWLPDPGTWAGVDHERVPMIWGRNDVGATVGGNSVWLMGFNEPDLSGQANLSTGTAAVLWREIERLYPERKLVAPAPSDVWPGWIDAMRYAYFARYGSWPRFDALAFHCYKPTANECIAIGRQFVAWARAWGVREVWCTEFAFLPAWTADAEGEARRFVAWLEGEPLVTRYAPFVSYIDFSAGPPWWWPWAGPDPSVLTETGELTAIGRWYARR